MNLMSYVAIPSPTNFIAGGGSFPLSGSWGVFSSRITSALSVPQTTLPWSSGCVAVCLRTKIGPSNAFPFLPHPLVDCRPIEAMVGHCKRGDQDFRSLLFSHATGEIDRILIVFCQFSVHLRPLQLIHRPDQIFTEHFLQFLPVNVLLPTLTRRI